jgi:hypothetical protein
MAKAKNTSNAESRKVSADILRKLDELSIGLSTVRGTATCVQLALINQISHGDRELAILVREYIVKELRRLHKQTQTIMIALGGRLPFSEQEELDDLIE